MTPIASTGASTTSRIACSSSKASVLKSGATALLSIAALLLSATSAQAATYYWDEDQATAGFGTAAGTWAAPTADKWSSDAAGADPTAVASYTTVNGDSLYFGTDTVALGSGTIAVTGTVTATQLLFGKASGAITLGMARYLTQPLTYHQFKRGCSSNLGCFSSWYRQLTSHH